MNSEDRQLLKEKIAETFFAFLREKTTHEVVDESGNDLSEDDRDVKLQETSMDLAEDALASYEA